MPNELNIRAAIALLETRSGNTKLAAEYVRSLKQDAAQMGFGLIASGDLSEPHVAQVLLALVVSGF